MKTFRDPGPVQDSEALEIIDNAGCQSERSLG